MLKKITKVIIENNKINSPGLIGALDFKTTIAENLYEIQKFKTRQMDLDFKLKNVD